MKDFGAAGDGATDDTAAFGLATAHGALTGESVRVPKGTYLVDPSSIVITGTGHADRFILTGESGSSIIKIKDGSMQAGSLPWQPLIQIGNQATGGQDWELIELRDLVLDMNARGNPLPGVDEWEWQHNHAFTISPDAGTIKQVRCVNVTVKDPVADGFNVSFTGTAVVEKFVIADCAVIDRDRVRSDIVLASAPDKTVIDGFAGEVIEMELVDAVTSKRRIHISNAAIDRLDMVTDAADYTTGNVEVYLDNVAAATSTVFQGPMVKATNCTFKVLLDTNISRWWCLQPGTLFSGCLFLHEYDAATTSVGQLQPMTSSTYSFTTNMRLVGCESRIDDASANSVTATITVTIASPGVVTWVGHGLADGTPIMFNTTGALPTGLTAGTVYYVKSPATDTFNVAATAGGAAINTSGSQSGTHTAIANPATGAAILGTSGVTPATLDNANLEIIGHKFDSRFATSVYANQCGRVRLVDCRYGGTIAAVKYQSGAATAVDLSVEGGDYRKVSGASIGTSMATVDQVAGIGYLRLTGTHVGVVSPWVSISGALPSTSDNQVYSNRRMIMAATPTKGIKGDIIDLQAPTAGAVDSYRCTAGPTTAGGSATWKARTTLAA